MENIYLKITKEFNKKRLRAIIASGQAVVLHRLAIMSKDGDWMVREDEEALNHILDVLSEYNAHYRYGAPLDIRWMAGGWSAHFEFKYKSLRIRTDFFTRSPRLLNSDIQRIWKEQEQRSIPFLDPPDLAELKKTNREKDYVIIGELARIMFDVKEKVMYSRSARDLIHIEKQYPQIVRELRDKRPVLVSIESGRDALEKALDAERRQLMHQYEDRILVYVKAAEKWAERWRHLSKKLSGVSLKEMHQKIILEAENYLPFNV